MVFTADDGVAGNELWVSDGTAAGTTLLKDINFGTASSLPYPFMTMGDLVFFQARNSTSGYELFVSDGTATGTRLVKDILPGKEFFVPAQVFQPFTVPERRPEQGQ